MLTDCTLRSTQHHRIVAASSSATGRTTHQVRVRACAMLHYGGCSVYHHKLVDARYTRVYTVDKDREKPNGDTGCGGLEER